MLVGLRQWAAFVVVFKVVGEKPISGGSRASGAEANVAMLTGAPEKTWPTAETEI